MMSSSARSAAARKAAASRAARLASVIWRDSEWDDDGWSADVNGICADVFPSASGGWAWVVKPSGSRCEFPEVYGSGWAKSPQAAKNKAAASALKADASYRFINYS